MNRRTTAMEGILNAARHVCQSQLEEAALRRLSRGHVFVAAVALEAVHAYLRIWGADYLKLEEEPAPLEYRSAPERVAAVVGTPAHSCGYGPN